MAAGYTSGKLLLKLDFTSYILQHHTAEHFAFLDDPANSRSRTTFYFTLARLLFVEDTPAKFKAFVAPLQQVRPASVQWESRGDSQGDGSASAALTRHGLSRSPCGTPPCHALVDTLEEGGLRLP